MDKPMDKSLDKDQTVEVQPNPSGQIALEPTRPLESPETPKAPARFSGLRRLFRNPKLVLGVSIMLVFIATAVFAPLIAPGDPSSFVSTPHQPPSAEYPFGTEGQGKDVFAQTVWGTRISLTTGLSVGILTTLIGVIVGMTSGYFGGRVDDVLSLLTNVVLIIPGLPLLVALAAFLPPGNVTVALVLIVTGWAWGARVLRAMTLSLREKDFVAAALVSGESHARIIFRDILPNMTSIIVGGMIGATIYAIGADATLSFLGFTNVSQVSWGTNLYWAQNNAGLLVGAWWTFVPSGLCIALVAFALSLINYAMDEVPNPRLRAEKEIANVTVKAKRGSLVTPVVRQNQPQR